jgi:hypothetical protein
MYTHRPSRSPLSAVLVALGRAAQVLLGLALLAGTALLGMLLLAGLLLRSLFRGSRGPSVRVDSAGMRHPGSYQPPVPPSRRSTGEVVDVEAREIGPSAR